MELPRTRFEFTSRDGLTYANQNPFNRMHIQCGHRQFDSIWKSALVWTCLLLCSTSLTMQGTYLHTVHAYTWTCMAPDVTCTHAPGHGYWTEPSDCIQASGTMQAWVDTHQPAMYIRTYVHMPIPLTLQCMLHYSRNSLKWPLSTQLACHMACSCVRKWTCCAGSQLYSHCWGLHQ